MIPILSGAGTLPECPYMDCGYRCCDFDSGNYIVLYPGELAKAILDGSSVEHLNIVDPHYLGSGTKVVCVAEDCSTCDGGYKPFDCAAYPLFPRFHDTWIKGSKCPLTDDMLEGHAAWVGGYFDALPTPIQAWFNQVQMVDYEDT